MNNTNSPSQSNTDFGSIHRLVSATFSRQLTCHMPLKNPIIAIGYVGQGHAIVELEKRFPEGDIIGFDTSQTKLNLVRKAFQNTANLKMPRLIPVSPEHILDHVKTDTLDCAILHFPPNTADKSDIIKKFYQTLKPGGMLSVTSHTKQNFSEIQSHTPKLVRKIFCMNKLISSINLPINHNSYVTQLKNQGFQVIDDYQINQKIEFRSFKDIKSWAIDSGWSEDYFQSFKTFKLASLLLVSQIIKVFRPHLFPVKLTTDISVLLVKKS